MPTLSKLFDQYSRPIPPRLHDWEKQSEIWCNEYRASFQQAEILEINLDLGVFLFDYSTERVILAYALSTTPLEKRDTSRMQGFPNPNISVAKIMRQDTFFADKGHFLSHASGGKLDINIFPQRRELNRGWSEEGKQFRKMERYVAKHTGTFFYHRPIYNDETWIPDDLEYGVLRDDNKWWVEKFSNK